MLFLCLVFFSLSSSRSPADVVVSDTSGKRLEFVGRFDWKKGTCENDQNVLHLDGEELFQPIDGFGGSFLRSGALALSLLKQEQQDAVLKSLFETAGFSVGKVPIGACDYCVLSFENTTTWWGYRENQSLPFDLGPDLESPGGTIPYILRARRYMEEELLLQSTMDYPPSWMLSGQYPNATVNPKFYPDLAKYFLDYTMEFRKRTGFSIKYLSLFNEPSDSYTFISTEEIANLLVNHVGPLFRASNSLTGLTYASQADRVTTHERTPKALKIPGVLNYTDVLFYHGYDCNPWICTGFNSTCPELAEAELLIEELHRAYPDTPLWMSEVCYAEEYGSYQPPCPNLPFSAFEEYVFLF